MLHPGIGYQNPPGGDRSSQSCEPGRSQVETFADLIPPEKHDGNKRGLHKESQNALDGKRRAKNITYKPGIVTPVGSELKLKDQSRGYTYGKVDTENLHPKLGCPFPELIACFIIKGFHDTHNDCQAESEWHKNPMVHGCQSKLGSRPVNK
jgi:hypothetical protein